VYGPLAATRNRSGTRTRKIFQAPIDQPPRPALLVSLAGLSLCLPALLVHPEAGAAGSKPAP